MSGRRVFVLPHALGQRAEIVTAEAVGRLQRAGMMIRMFGSDAARVAVDGVETVGPEGDAEGCELVAVFGGDGTILRGADLAHGFGIPLLGLNLGHVGFLAELESDEVDHVVAAIVGRDYTVEERLSIDIEVIGPDGSTSVGWALNEASIEKTGANRMLDLVVAIDDQPLSRWSCDGVLCATPTGSTAYAWSAGGPVVWPDVEALVVVPSNAHALFNRALVVSPDSVIGVRLLEVSPPAGLWCDGRRELALAPGSRVVVRRGAEPVRLARFHPGSFTERLVAKFQLPVAGWRRSGGPEASS